jgi:hypothetical protein
MKLSNVFALLLAFAGLALIGCERHSFDETKGLHMDHGAGHHDEGHGDAGHGKDGHAKDPHAKDGHGEKGHAEKAAAPAHPEAKPEASKEEPRKTGL